MISEWPLWSDTCAVCNSKYSPWDTRIQDGDEILTQIQQDCLTSNGYNEAKCQNAIKRLYECCEAFYERYGEEASTVSCPKPNLLKLKMKQLREEAKWYVTLVFDVSAGLGNAGNLNDERRISSRRSLSTQEASWTWTSIEGLFRDSNTNADDIMIEKKKRKLKFAVWWRRTWARTVLSATNPLKYTVQYARVQSRLFSFSAKVRACSKDRFITEVHRHNFTT